MHLLDHSNNSGLACLDNIGLHLLGKVEHFDLEPYLDDMTDNY